MQENESKRVAVFGGSFNPIHDGHVAVVNALLKKQVRIVPNGHKSPLIDQVIVVPCGCHSFDKKLIPFKDRFEMAKRVFQNNPSVKVSDVESDNTKKSKTVETMQKLRNQPELYYDQLYCVVGSDNLFSINRWNRFGWIKGHIPFIIIQRPGYEVCNLYGITIEDVISSDEVGFDKDISSTYIRHRIEFGGGLNSVAEYLPIVVYDYIKNENIVY